MIPQVRTRIPLVTPSSRVRSMEGRGPLGPATVVRFDHSRPLAAGANCSAPRSERGGSRFEAWAASHFHSVMRTTAFVASAPREHRSTERTDRYERSDWGSSPCAPASHASSGLERTPSPVRIWPGLPRGRAQPAECLHFHQIVRLNSSIPDCHGSIPSRDTIAPL